MGLVITSLLMVACLPASVTPAVPYYYTAITPPYLTRVITTANTPTSVSFSPTPTVQASSLRSSVTATVQRTIPLTLHLQPPNLESLRQTMLDAINRDRATAGLKPVQLDLLASQVGQAHSEEMAENNYMSHWNLKGLGPDLRYALADGNDNDMENVYMTWNRYSSGTPVPVSDWNLEVQEAESGWMSSPGHRANILTPEHTHVGIGIAYNPVTGDIRMAQEFINHYVELDPLPQTAALGDTVAVSGKLLAGVSAPLINLAYEPAPHAMSIAQLAATSSYASPAKNISAINILPDAQGRFKVNVPIEGNYLPGVYHIRIWVNWNGTSILATEPMVWVNVAMPQ